MSLPSAFNYEHAYAHSSGRPRRGARGYQFNPARTIGYLLRA